MVLNAGEKIQNALAANGRTIAAQEGLPSISERTMDLSRSSYQIGEGDFLCVPDARAALAAANRARR